MSNSEHQILYDKRKTLTDELKDLTRDQYEEIFRIVKRTNTPYSENNNGIFFDLNVTSDETIAKLIEYMVFVRTQRMDDKKRLEELEFYKHETPEES